MLTPSLEIPNPCAMAMVVAPDAIASVAYVCGCEGRKYLRAYVLLYVCGFRPRKIIQGQRASEPPRAPPSPRGGLRGDSRGPQPNQDYQGPTRPKNTAKPTATTWSTMPGGWSMWIGWGGLLGDLGHRLPSMEKATSDVSKTR
jgi:hypothetical protein